MSVRLKSAPVSRSISVIQGGSSTASVVIKKGDDISLQSLTNVVSTDLKDGYTIIWDEDTKKWVSQPIIMAAVVIDGGSY